MSDMIAKVLREAGLCVSGWITRVRRPRRVLSYPRCRDCRWWDVSDEPGEPPLGDGYGVCLDASYTCYGPGEVSAYARGGGPGYLKTRHDFGCARWEAKSDD